MYQRNMPHMADFKALFILKKSIKTHFNVIHVVHMFSEIIPLGSFNNKIFGHVIYDKNITTEGL